MTKYPEIRKKIVAIFDKHSHYIRSYDGHDIDIILINRGGASEELIKLFEQSLSEREKRVREEMVDKAFDWIWGGWNLDLSKLDRAKAHFLSLTPQNDTHSQDDLKDLGLKPRKINFKKISKLANIINKAMEKENK